MDTLTTLQGICQVVGEGFNKLDLYMDTLTTLQGICWLLVNVFSNEISIWRH